MKRSYDSLLGPCKTAGKPVEILDFDGDAENAMALLKKSFDTSPDADIVLADDAVGTYAGYRIHLDWMKAGHRGFLLAGYLPYDYRIVTFLERVQNIGDRSVTLYAAKTGEAIKSLLDGQQVTGAVEVPVKFSKETEKPASSTTRKQQPARKGAKP